MDRIEAYLEKENVNYVNLKEILESSDEVLYHERDSHWNNKGAALAGDALMTALDKEHTDYTQESYEECVDFTGDLAAPEMDGVLHELGQLAAEFRILGNFRGYEP